MASDLVMRAGGIPILMTAGRWKSSRCAVARYYQEREG
jgi:hypothetical protein